MRDVFPGLGLPCTQAETDLAGIGAGDAAHEVLYGTPTNPRCGSSITQSDCVCEEATLVSIIDNSFATPVLQQPLSLGFDMVVHSVTKGLAGHRM
jgi:cystathionine beta-lyase/cystathionine gamma-synthase